MDHELREEEHIRHEAGGTLAAHRVALQVRSSKKRMVGHGVAATLRAVLEPSPKFTRGPGTSKKAPQARGVYVSCAYALVHGSDVLE